MLARTRGRELALLPGLGRLLQPAIFNPVSGLAAGRYCRAAAIPRQAWLQVEGRFQPLSPGTFIVCSLLVSSTLKLVV